MTDYSVPTNVSVSKMNHSKKTVPELKAICKEYNIKGVSKKNKKELIDIIIKKEKDIASETGTHVENPRNLKLETNKIAIPDCFVSPNLKLSNGKNGHGERRLYTGDSHEENEKLTTKPWAIKYSENYYDEIKPILNDETNFAKKCPNRVKNVLKFITDVQNKLIYLNSQNGAKDVRRYYVGPQKENKENVKLWDTFRNTIIPKGHYLKLIEYDEHFECCVMCIKANPPNNNKKCNSVSNAQMEYFKYLEKKLDIEIQGAHNSTEFQLRNPENGYYWPIDGIHICGTHRCSGSKDLPCPYNMNVWEFQGDYFHGNPEKYDKDDKFHSVTIETKWNKDKKKKEYYESQGYTVNITWESEWIAEKKLLQSEGKTWHVYII